MRNAVLFFAIMVLSVFMAIGCDQVRNPLSSISGGLGDNNESIGIPGPSTDVTISLGQNGEGLTGKVLFPGDLKVSKGTSLAPSSTGNIIVESNMFADANYPEAKTVSFNTTDDFKNTKIKAHTVVICYLKATVKDGGELLDIWLNGTKLTNYVSGSFQFVIETDGKVTQLKSAQSLKDVSFSLQSNESSGKTIYISSDQTGWASVPMVFKNGSWTYSGSYLPNKTFHFVMWSETRSLYVDGITANGTAAIFLFKTQDATDTAYAVYQFEGKVDNDGKFINGGADNRTIMIN